MLLTVTFFITLHIITFNISILILNSLYFITTYFYILFYLIFLFLILFIIL